MTNRYTYSTLIILILMSVLLTGTGNVYATQPVVTAVTYMDSLNVLEFVFDQPVFNDSTRVIRDGIEVHGVVSDKAQSVALAGGKLPGDPENETAVDTIRLVVTYQDQKLIENLGYASPEDLSLVLPGGRFINAAYEGNVAAENFPIAFIPFIKKPQPLKVTYNAIENTLGFKFDKIVKAKDNVDLLKITLADGAGNSLTFTSNHEFVPGIVASDSVTITFTPRHQEIIEGFATASMNVTLAAYAFIDPMGNTCKTVDNFPVNYVIDNQPTEIDTAYYDAVKNTLYIQFNENISTTYKRYFWLDGKQNEEKLEAVAISGISVYDNVNAKTVTLSAYKSISFKSTSLQLEILVSPEDQILLETLDSTDDLKLLVNTFAILDEGLNGIREYTLADDISVGYVPETDDDAPVVEQALYYAGSNLLELRFGNIKPQTKGIDTTTVTLPWITLHAQSGKSVSLSGGGVHGVKAGVPKFIRNIFIEILPEDEVLIEGMSNGDSLKLSMEPLTFFFESYSKTGNGNHVLSLDQNLGVEYLPDTMAVEISSFKNNFEKNELQIKLNKAIKYNKFNASALNVAGVQLSGGTVVDSSVIVADSVHSMLTESQVAVYDYNLTVSISDADQAKINELDNATKAALTVTVDAGSITNLDGVSNETISINEASTLSDGNSVFVGYGRSFWDQSYEAFRTSDELVPSSLRAVGDNCYIYVSDKDWLDSWEDANGNKHPIITQAIVDSFLVAFEQSTPADASKGIYQICREYFGNEIDTDDDPRITILFTNLRDEYDQGRSNRASNVPRAGAYMIRNELPDSVNAHSAMTDMIFVDSEPIIRAGTALQAVAQYFTQMIFRNVDPNEEQWLIEGLSGLAQVLCGYKYTSHVFPAETPKLSANKTLNYWTGWDGGTPAIDVAEFYHTSLFALYVYEQFGKPVIQAIAADTANGLQSVRNSLPESSTLENVFDDYAIAGFLDKLNHPVYGDRFGFKAVDFGFPFLKSITWSTSDATDQQLPWSFSFFKTKKTQAIDQVKFNGIDATQMSLIFTTIEDDFLYKKATLDSENEGLVDVSDLKVADILTCVTSKSSTGPTYLDYVISKDITPPQEVNLAVMQNPSVDRNLSIYIISDEQLYQDVGLESPKVTISNGGIVTELSVEIYFANTDASMHSYLAKYTVPGSGTYSVTVNGQDKAGNNISEKTVGLSAQKIIAEQGGVIGDPLQKATLDIAPAGMANDHLITAFIDNVPTDKEQISGPIYRFGPSNVNFSIPARLTLHPENIPSDRALVVCRLDGDKWVSVGGKLNEKTGTMTVLVDRLGDFKVMAGEPTVELTEPIVPKVYSLDQNYPNPFNPTTYIQYGLPKLSHVTLEVYNSLGQRVAILRNGQQDAGVYQIQWDASHQASGLYFYRIDVRSSEDNESFKQIRKMMVIK
ncbi:T9SS type A sorting domain-containing protein [candidate division KSB1 bacterium]|nr:T9SS type A sorting domain-containing protein [candidate division KSB1 bacterium]